MSDIFNKFRNVFISDKNSGYILNLVVNKLNNQYSEYKDLFTNNNIIQRYYLILLDLQGFIYDTYFDDIFNELSKDENFNLEELLISLNKLTINKFEMLIHQDINNNQPQITEERNNNEVEEFRNTKEHKNELEERKQMDIDTRNNEIRELKENNNDVQHKETIEIVKTTQKNLKNNDVSNLQKMTNSNNVSIVENEKNTFIQYHHFFSKDATLTSGRYKFPIKLKNIKGIKMSFLKLDCNIYNITESNNKFFIVEKDTRVPITIPIGYYNIDNLLEKISDVMTFNSPNKLTYNVVRNMSKNKIYFACSSYDNIGTVVKFNLEFIKGENDFSTPLREILGFNKNEYINNNLYVSEKCPITNILNDIFIKMYINDREITRYTTTTRDFSYYERLYIDLDKYFGKTYCLKDDYFSMYDILEDITSDDISLEFWTSTKNSIKRVMNFDFILTFECAE